MEDVLITAQITMSVLIKYVDNVLILDVKDVNLTELSVFFALEETIYIEIHVFHNAQLELSQMEELAYHVV